MGKEKQVAMVIFHAFILANNIPHSVIAGIDYEFYEMYNDYLKELTKNAIEEYKINIQPQVEPF